MTARTFSRVSCLVSGERLMTREMVRFDTLARRAMSLMVRRSPRCGSASSSLGLIKILPAFRSHYRIELPRLKLILAESHRLALGLLAGSGGEDQLEYPISHLRHRDRAIEDRAAIDIHIVGHAAIKRGVGGQLQTRCGLGAIDRAAAGSEAEDVGAAGDLAGSRDRVVSGRVHENQPLGRHRFGIA